MQQAIYLNLTNGIEALNVIKKPYSFIRIQSTACEQKRWDFILQDLDYNFLMDIALGKEVFIYDYGANKSVPRALYQGVEFIKFVLNRYWFNKEYYPIVKNNNTYKYFNEIYNKLDKKTFKKLEYFKKFLFGKEADIKCISSSTRYDSNYQFYRDQLAATLI